MKAWLISMFSLVLLPVWGQEGINLLNSGEHLTIGVGIAFNTVRDQAHSTLTYNGNGLRFFVSYERIRPDWVSRTMVSFDNVNLKARVKPRRDIRRSASLSDMQLTVGLYARLGDDQLADNQQYVGGTWNLQINSRNYPLPTNNRTGVMLQSSFGVGALDRRTISGADDWAFTTRVNVPVITALYRPTYIGIPPFLHIDKVKAKHVLSNIDIVSFSRFFKFEVGEDGDHQSRAWRTDRLSYDWNIFHTPVPATKPITSTTGSLVYGFRVLL